MSIKQRQVEQTWILDLDGVVQPDVLIESINTLLTQPTTHISLNMGQLQFAESLFLSVLLKCNATCTEQKVHFSLFGLTPNVKNLVELTRLNTILTLLPDEAAALAWQPKEA